MVSLVEERRGVAVNGERPAVRAHHVDDLANDGLPADGALHRQLFGGQFAAVFQRAVAGRFGGAPRELLAAFEAVHLLVGWVASDMEALGILGNGQADRRGIQNSL